MVFVYIYVLKYWQVSVDFCSDISPYIDRLRWFLLTYMSSYIDKFVRIFALIFLRILTDWDGLRWFARLADCRRIHPPALLSLHCTACPSIIIRLPSLSASSLLSFGKVSFFCKSFFSLYCIRCPRPIVSCQLLVDSWYKQHFNIFCGQFFENPLGQFLSRRNISRSLSLKTSFVANLGHSLLAVGWELWIRMFLSANVLPWSKIYKMYFL